MKKPTLLFFLALFICSGVKAQVKTDSLHSTIGTISDSMHSSLKATGAQFSNIDFSQWTYSYRSSDEYPDTLQCLFHEYSTEILLDKWTSGYVILINGMLKTGHVSWSPDYAPMALGFFDNQFLYDDKHPIKNKVLQVILYNTK